LLLNLPLQYPAELLIIFPMPLKSIFIDDSVRPFASSKNSDSYWLE
jgi:hypothetical protein